MHQTWPLAIKTVPCISQGSGNTFEVHVGTTLMRTLYFIRNFAVESYEEIILEMNQYLVKV